VEQSAEINEKPPRSGIACNVREGFVKSIRRAPDAFLRTAGRFNKTAQDSSKNEKANKQ